MLTGLWKQTTVAIYEPKIPRPGEACGVDGIRISREHYMEYPDTLN